MTGAILGHANARSTSIYANVPAKRARSAFGDFELPSIESPRSAFGNLPA
jgi:hypothetical protein